MRNVFKINYLILTILDRFWVNKHLLHNDFLMWRCTAFLPEVYSLPPKGVQPTSQAQKSYPQ